MPEKRAILKNRTLPPAMDYAFLRQKGIEYVTELASKVWTDHNIHDPGVTTLEVLSYAITELTYRTRLPIEDLLTREDSDKTKDFFTAREILPCNPLTIEDIRLLIIDCDGVENAWVEGLKQPAFYYGCEEDGSGGYSIRLKGSKGLKAKTLKGLYSVSLQLEEDEELGDLNTNIIEWKIEKDGTTIPIRVVVPPVEVSFPRYKDEASLLQVLESDAESHIFEWVSKEALEFTLKIRLKEGRPKTLVAGMFKVLLPPYVSMDVADRLEELFTEEGEDSFFGLYFKRLKRTLEIIEGVYCRLHSHRNLCEDYSLFRVVRTQEVSLCADIELSPEADPEEVLARVFFEVDRFLAPPVRFYTLKEMLHKGKGVDEIFEGTLTDKGFVDREELAASDLKESIHLSDLYRLLSEIEGVVAVRELIATNYLDGVAQTDGERWCLRLGGRYHLNLRADWSRVLFYKKGVPFYADTEQAMLLFQHMKAEGQRPKLSATASDLEVPAGRALRLDEYCSIQRDFPLVYGIGKEGLPADATEHRKAQAKQFKAFLSLFDQLLANYLAQLFSVKDLLSVGATVESTYSVRPLYSIAGEEEEDFPAMEHIIKDFLQFVAEKEGVGVEELGELASIDGIEDYWKEFKEDPNNGYLRKLKEYTEPEELFVDRRNRFLDHLIARFAESFTDYAMTIYTSVAGRSSAEKLSVRRELIAHKEEFLKNYPEISRDRARAFCYRCINGEEHRVWNSTNVSGLKKRLSKLLGMEDISRRTLGYCEEEVNEDFTVNRTGERSYMVVLRTDVDRDPYGYEEQALKSKSFRADTIEEARKKARQIIGKIIESSPLKENYRIVRLSQRYRVELLDSDGKVLAWCRKRFKKLKDAEAYRDRLLGYMKSRYFKEGFHLFEHLLLRPVADWNITAEDLEEGFVRECMGPDCDCPVTDFYSFRITVVLPAWLERFKDMRFRGFVEHTIREEVPAHIMPRICWISPCEMKELEKLYRAWLQELTKRVPDRKSLQERAIALVKKLNSLTTVYPEARLTDCKDPEGRNITILDKTILGTLKGEER